MYDQPTLTQGKHTKQPHAFTQRTPFHN